MQEAIKWLSRTPDERSSMRASDRCVTKQCSKTLLNRGSRWSQAALSAVLKMPWHIVGAPAAAAAAAAGNGGDGHGVSIDMSRHVLPPEGVTVHSWCSDAIVCHPQPNPNAAFYAAVGVHRPALHEWARGFVFNSRYWTASANGDAASAARDACIIELLDMIHGETQEIKKLAACLRGEMLLLLLLLLIGPNNPRPPSIRVSMCALRGRFATTAVSSLRPRRQAAHPHARPPPLHFSRRIVRESSATGGYSAVRHAAGRKLDARD